MKLMKIMRINKKTKEKQVVHSRPGIKEYYVPILEIAK